MRAPYILVLAALAVAGCATPPPAVEAPAPVVAPQPAAGLEQAYRQRAAALAAERRWAEAAIQWELLTVLRPDSTAYRDEAAAARGRSAEMSQTHFRAAEQARRRGDNEQAATLLLRALSADPANAAAAQGLQAIELERSRRAWLNRPPRIPYTPPGPAQPYDPSKDDTGPRR
jgi:tetratricopeptide (TPR) repeat protein